MEMDREKLIKDIERQMSEPTSEYVVLWFSEAEYVLELMKKQEKQKFFVDESGKITPLPVVVRCKDCKWRGTEACFCKAKDDVKDDWFCSEGEKAVSE